MVNILEYFKTNTMSSIHRTGQSAEQQQIEVDQEAMKMAIRALERWQRWQREKIGTSPSKIGLLDGF